MMYEAAYRALLEREKKRQDRERAVEAKQVLTGAIDSVLGRRAGARGSAPGSPPMMRSGTLRASVKPMVVPGEVMDADLELGTGYAGYLESGTGKMAARPFRERILAQAEPRLMEINGRAYRLPPRPKEMLMDARRKKNGGATR